MLSRKGVQLQNLIKFVIPDPDPVSPAFIKSWRSRIKPACADT